MFGSIALQGQEAACGHPVGSTRRRVGTLVITSIAQPDNARVWKHCDWLWLVASKLSASEIYGCVGEWENRLGPSVISVTAHHAYKLECEDHRCWSRPLFVSFWVLLIARVWQMLARRICVLYHYWTWISMVAKSSQTLESLTLGRRIKCQTEALVRVFSLSWDELRHKRGRTRVLPLLNVQIQTLFLFKWLTRSYFVPKKSKLFVTSLQVPMYFT